LPDDLPIGRHGDLLTQLFEKLSEGGDADRLKAPHMSDGQSDVGSGDPRSRPDDFLPGRPDESLGPAQMSQRVFLEQLVQEGVKFRRKGFCLGQNVLRDVFPIGPGVGGKVRVLEDPVSAPADIPAVQGDLRVRFEDLDLTKRDLDPDLLVPKPVGYGVIRFLQTDRAVRMNAACLPVKLFEGRVGKGPERPFLLFFEPLLPGDPKTAVGAGVEPLHHSRQSLVDLGKASEGVLSVKEEKIPTDDFDRPFNQGLLVSQQMHAARARRPLH